jgi:DNA-binding NarL/FixJ family response regulator
MPFLDGHVSCREACMTDSQILIVDDEEAILKLLKRILSAEGLLCITAASAGEARSHLSRQSFDLVLSDIEMPGESGLELINFVKSNYPDTGIVVVSVLIEQEVARTAMETGIFGYIVKPFEKSQVIITVSNALRRAALEKSEKNKQAELERLVRERTADLLTMQESLRRREIELENQRLNLEQADSAIRVMMKSSQHDRAQVEEQVLMNVKQTVRPYMEKLRRSGLSDRQRSYLDILEASLQDIVSPFVRALSSDYIDLTPTELQVAQLIKEGKNTKEISAVLNLSMNTIMTHRYKIRSKLGLLNKKNNLHTFLKTLA